MPRVALLSVEPWEWEFLALAMEWKGVKKAILEEVFEIGDEFLEHLRRKLMKREKLTELEKKSVEVLKKGCGVEDEYKSD